MINCCRVFLEYVDVVSRILERGAEKSGVLYSLFRAVQLVITAHIFMLFFFLPLHLSLSFPLSLASCQPLIVFWCSCRLVMVLLPFQAQTQRRVVHSHEHAHTHAVVSSNIHQTCCHLTGTQCVLFCIYPYSISLLSVIVCPANFRSVSSFSAFSATPDPIGSPTATHAHTQRHAVSQCLCQMQWCQMRSLHVKCVHVFSDFPAPLPLTPPRTAVEVNICTQSWTVEGCLWPTSPCCIKY